MAEPVDFASMFESQTASGGRKTAQLAAGEQVEGTVLAISGGLVILDIGSSADAVLDLTELDDRAVRVGDRLRASVKNPRSDGPVLTLALGRGGSTVDIAELELAREGGTPVNGTVTSSNKGGFSVDISGVRAFCPISQIDLNFVNEPESYVGQTLNFQVMEIREGGRNVVVSRKKLLQDELRQNEEALAKDLSPGAIVEGTVKATIRHGAIIDLSGLDAFVPMSELSRARIERAEDVVTVGERVRAKVLTVERNDRGLNVRLSLKALETFDEKQAPQKDEILNGKVVKHIPGGLIVTTEKGDGLVPSHELSLAPGADHRRAYPLETELRVVVVNRDSSSGRLRMSVGKVAQVEERNNYRQFHHDGSNKGGDSLGSLGELMSKKFPDLAAQAHAAAPQGRPAGEVAMARAVPRATVPHAPASQTASNANGDTSKKDVTGVRRRK